MARPSADPIRQHARPLEIAESAPERPDVDVVIPALPPEITTDRGRDLWTVLWTVGAGVYQTETHYEVVARYVGMQQRRDQFIRVLDEEGWTVVGSQGQDVLHPLARQLDSLEGRLVALEDRLGLSPEASVRLGIATAMHKNKLDEFLAGF